MSMHVCMLAMLSAACMEEIARNDGAERGHSLPETGVDDARCFHSSDLDALPTMEVGFTESPDARAAAARGTWMNGAGDLLVIDFEGRARRVEWLCAGDPATPQPPGVGPHVRFEVPAHVVLRTADGVWDERFDVTIRLSASQVPATTGATLVSGSARLLRDELGGSFAPPPEREAEAGREVSISLWFESNHWQVSSSVLRRGEGTAPLVRGEPLVFDRRTL